MSAGGRNKILARRDDGITVSLANSDDYLKLIELANNLSEQSKQFFHPWMFRKNPPLKTKIGQILVRLSLNPHMKKLIKIFFLFAYAVIVKCESADNEIIGMGGFFKFKKSSDGKFRVEASYFIIDKFQGKNIHTFIESSSIEIAKKENTGIIISRFRTDNFRMKKSFIKCGWNYKETLNGASEYKGKKYDTEIWFREINN